MDELALTNDLKQIEFEIQHHKQIAGQSIWEIGRRLSHVKDNDLVHGEFVAWVENKVNINRTEAYRYMKVSKEIPNDDTWQHLGSRALYLIATLPEEEREKEHATSSGNRKKVDEMTVKELQELKRELKEKEQQIQTLKNRKTKIVEKPVIKEVKPHDYEGLKSDNDQLSLALKEKQTLLDDANKRNDFIEKQYKEILEDRKGDLDREKWIEKIQSELVRLANRRNKMSNELDSIKQLASLKNDVDQILEKIAPYYFNQAVNTLRQDPLLEQTFLETVNALQKWCDEMYRLLGKQNTFEGEIIND